MSAKWVIASPLIFFSRTDDLPLPGFHHLPRDDDQNGVECHPTLIRIGAIATQATRYVSFPFSVVYKLVLPIHTRQLHRAYSRLSALRVVPHMVAQTRRNPPVFPG